MSTSGPGAAPERTLGDLLAEGEQCALRGSPGSALAPLEAALAAAQRRGARSEGLAAAWLRGVALGALGRYGEALSALGPLAAAVSAGAAVPDLPPAREPPPLDDSPAAAAGGEALFGSFAASTVASLHRQLGDHATARTWDSAALAAAQPLGEPGAEAVMDALLGLAADAVGLGERGEAEAGLVRAEEVVTGRHAPGWRPTVRLAWVRAEVALLSDQPEVAIQRASEALRTSEQAQAPRHVAKSLLFLGVAQASGTAPGEPPARTSAASAAVTLRRAASLAENLAATPLVWPARAMLGALLAVNDPRESARCLAAARDAVHAIAGRVPEPLRSHWLGRPDVAALLGTPAA